MPDSFRLVNRQTKGFRFMNKTLVFLLYSLIFLDSAFAADSTSCPAEYVDLGLPSGTLWATCNLGADKPEDAGDFYAWGETQTKEHYTLKYYRWYSTETRKYTAYCTDSIYGIVDSATVLRCEDDAASVILGDEWRIPTREEMEELLDECEWRWVSDYYTGVTGKLGTSKRNGNTIFLPASGRLYGNKKGYGDGGLYQTSSLDKDVSLYVWYFSFNSTREGLVNVLPRYFGTSIRPVKVSKRP